MLIVKQHKPHLLANCKGQDCFTLHCIGICKFVELLPCETMRQTSWLPFNFFLYSGIAINFYVPSPLRDHFKKIQYTPYVSSQMQTVQHAMKSSSFTLSFQNSATTTRLLPVLH